MSRKAKPKGRVKICKVVEHILSRHICLNVEGRWDAVVSIPVLADEDVIDTVRSVLKARENMEKSRINRKRVAVVVLLNDSEITPTHLKKKNKMLFENLRKNFSESDGVFVRWLKDIPEKISGVGFARRVAMDESICVFSREFLEGRTQEKEGLWEEESMNERFFDFLRQKFIFSLDSDVEVSEDYFSCAFSSLDMRNAGFGVYLFEHRLSDNPEEKEAGILWELFLRYWRDSLRVVSYPFAFYPIGSLFVMRASTYALTGGMNIRKAGEDFYFMQKVFGVEKVVDIPAYVFPKAVAVERTPFGTGKEISLYISGKKDRLRKVWRFETFKLIGELISSGDLILDIRPDDLGGDGEEFNTSSGNLSGENLSESAHFFFLFLRENPKFLAQFENIRHMVRQMKEDNPRRRKELFLSWFLPFKVFKFLRFCERFFKKGDIEVEVGKLVSEIKSRFPETEKLLKQCGVRSTAQNTWLEDERYSEKHLEFLKRFDLFLCLLDCFL